MHEETNRILIIGAGLSGLALAQSLLAHKPPIPFHIYERDETSAFRAQGYRIRINPAGGAALRALLPADLFSLFERTSSKVVPGGHTYDAATGDELPPSGPRPAPSGPPGLDANNQWNVDRTVIRNVLLQGLEPYISYGKKFKHYTCSQGESTPTITASFENGTTATGSFLIGADGTRSPVRSQALPSFKLLETAGRAVFGKTPFSEDGSLPSGIRPYIEQGLNLVRDTSLPDENVTLFCDAMHFKHDTPDLVHTLSPLPQDYIYWVLVFQDSHPSLQTSLPSPATHLLSLTPDQSLDLARTMTASWNPSASSIITHADPSASSTLTFSMAEPGFSIASSAKSVTLLGDAAHPMPPVGGVGANSAFQDAQELAEVIGRHWHAAFKRSDGDSRDQSEQADAGSRNRFEQAVALYEESMAERCNGALQMSIGGARKFFALTK